MTPEQNQARLAALKDRKTGDLFAAGPEAEELTLLGERMTDPETFAGRLERATAAIEREEPEQSLLF